MKVGFNHQLNDYENTICTIAKHVSGVPCIDSTSKLYESIETDSQQILELICITNDTYHENVKIVIHIHSYTMAVAELRFPSTMFELNAVDLERRLQSVSEEILKGFYREVLFPQLKRASENPEIKYIEPLGSYSVFDDLTNLSEKQDVQLLWTSRLICLSLKELRENKQFVRNWLRSASNTTNLNLLLKGKLSFSFEWLNYVLISDVEVTNDDYRVDAMCQAQFAYSVLYLCNKRLLISSSKAFLDREHAYTEKQLFGIRAVCRIHKVLLTEARLSFHRRKKKLFDEILVGWSYSDLEVESEKLIEICNARISEIQAGRNNRSSFYTDLILVLIGFVSIFDLVISISGYSRNYMSTALLSLRDKQPSAILSKIAMIDTDEILLTSGFFIFSLFMLYIFLKSRQ